jgi:tetratricopeptide (TPR) repeat protein
LKAVELDPMVADAQGAVGAISADDWKWERAEEAFRKAMDLNPDSPEACHWYTALLSILGRHAESVALIKHSAAANPLSSASFANLGLRLYDARRYQEAETAFRRALGMESENFVARVFLAEVYYATSRFEEAINTLDRPAFQGTALLAKAYAAAGRRREATELLRKILPVAMPSDYVPLAFTYAFLGDKDRAFEWMTKAFDAHHVYAPWAKVSPSYDVLRDDPRLDALIARLHLPD